MKREQWQQALQEGHLKCCGEVVSEKNIVNYGLDEGSMQLLFEDDMYYVVNYNEWGSSLHFINVVKKEDNTIQTMEV